MKHSPAPWEYAPKFSTSENHQGFWIRSEKPSKTGKWSHAEVQPGDEDGRLGEANARLIATAPDLLEAVKLFLLYDNESDANGLSMMIAYDKALSAAKAAITKAEAEL